MGKHALFVLNHTNCQHVQLGEFLASSKVDRKENWPSNQHAHKERVSQNLEVSQKEKSIERAMIKHESIRCFEEWLDPVEPAIGKWRYGRAARLSAVIES
jgi:hypothetical protein